MAQLCTIRSGKSDTQDAVADGPYAFFDRSRTVKRSSRYLYDCEALIIPGEGTEFLPRHFEGKFDLHQRAYALYDFSDRIDVRFLYYYLFFQRDYFPRVAVGATVKSLRLRHFEQLPVSLTDVPEQQRIAAILDEAFASIATASANTEQNLRNTRELFETHLDGVFSGHGHRGPMKRLGDVCSISSTLVDPRLGATFVARMSVLRILRPVRVDCWGSTAGEEGLRIWEVHLRPDDGSLQQDPTVP